MGLTSNNCEILPKRASVSAKSATAISLADCHKRIDAKVSEGDHYLTLNDTLPFRVCRELRKEGYKVRTQPCGNGHVISWDN
jgi:hypothetical protein